MADENVAESTDDKTGIPADMIADGETTTNGSGEHESFARRLGWRPEEEFRGPKDRWLPADQFVDKVEKEAPVLRERLRFQDDIISKQQRKLDEIEARTKEQSDLLRELHQNSVTAAQRGYARVKEEIKQRMERAVGEADTAGYKHAERELEELEKSAPKPSTVATTTTTTTQPANGARTVDPYVEQWVGENQWFRNDPVMNAAATALEASLMRERPSLSLKDRLQEVRNDMEKRFPEKFENAARKQPAAVATPGAPNNPVRRAGERKKTVADLPPGAQENLARFKRLIKGFTDKEFLESYQWDTE